MNLWQVLGQKAATPSTVLPPGIPEEQQEALRQSMSLKAAVAARELRSLSMRQAGQQQGPEQQVGLICWPRSNFIDLPDFTIIETLKTLQVNGQGWLSPEQLPACCDARVQQQAVLAVWTACVDLQAPVAEVRLRQPLKEPRFRLLGPSHHMIAESQCPSSQIEGVSS